MENFVTHVKDKSHQTITENDIFRTIAVRRGKGAQSFMGIGSHLSQMEVLRKYGDETLDIMSRHWGPL